MTISVSQSTSTNTGVAPHKVIRFTVDTQVIDGVITSSPGPIPKACSSTSIPAVTEVRAMACAQPVSALNCCSSSAQRAPVVIQPDSRTACTAAMSSAVIDGLENGKNDCTEASGEFPTSALGTTIPLEFFP